MEKKRKNNSKKKIKPFRILILLVAIYISWTFITQQIKLQELKEHEKQLQEKMAALQKQEKQLQEEKQLIDDPKYIEKVAREQLKMVKPNEILYIDTERAKYLEEKR